MTEDAKLRTQLEQLRSVLPNWEKYHYRGAADFVLQHGQSFAVRPFPAKIPQGAPRHCFSNALLLALTKGLRYVEGYATEPHVGLAVHHGWNIDSHGKLIDSTWLNQGLAYLGVEFSAERADDALWNGDASVLDDWHRQFPLFKQPWSGEDWTINWPENERVRLIRAGKLIEAYELAESEFKARQ